MIAMERPYRAAGWVGGEEIGDGQGIRSIMKWGKALPSLGIRSAPVSELSLISVEVAVGASKTRRLSNFKPAFKFSYLERL